VALDRAALDGVVARFHGEHERLYAHSAPGDPVEFVSLRTVAVGPVTAPAFQERPAAAGPAAPAERRPVFFEEADGFVDCPIYDRESLGPGARLVGPAVVEQMDSTTLVHPGHVALVDGFGNLVIAVGG
jgi:N-methylhydantoinase A